MHLFNLYFLLPPYIWCLSLTDTHTHTHKHKHTHARLSIVVTDTLIDIHAFPSPSTLYLGTTQLNAITLVTLTLT